MRILKDLGAKNFVTVVDKELTGQYGQKTDKSGSGSDLPTFKDLRTCFNPHRQRIGSGKRKRRSLRQEVYHTGQASITVTNKKRPARKAGATVTPEIVPRWGAAALHPYWLELVAGYCFGGFFLLRWGVAVAVAVAVAVGVTITVCVAIAVAAGWGDGYGLADVGEVSRDGFGNVAY